MALALTGRRSQEVSDTSGSISASFTVFTPSNDSLLCVFVFIVADADVGAGSGNSISGGSLSWSSPTSTASGTDGGSYFWNGSAHIAAVGTAGATTLIVTNAATVGDCRVQISAFDLTGYNTATPTGGKISGNIGEDGDGSLTLDAAPETDDYTVGARIFVPIGGTNTAATVGTGCILIHSIAGSAGYGNIYTQSRTASTTAATVWTDINSTGGVSGYTGQERGMAFVVKAAAVAGHPTVKRFGGIPGAHRLTGGGQFGNNWLVAA